MKVWLAAAGRTTFILMENSTTTCSYANPMVLTSGSLNPATTTDSGAFQFASSTCITLYGESTSTDPSYYNGFTYGEIIISSFLLIILVAVLYSFFWFSVKGFKIRQ
jgi:hypothetical protein